jgi:hypothetical protein
MRVLVTGGNTALRKSLAQALVHRSHEVHAVADAGRDAPSRAPYDAAIAVDPGVAPPSGDGFRLAPLSGTWRAIHDAGIRRLIRVRTLASRESSGQDGAPAASVMVRVAPVYGIGGDPVTSLLVTMRSLPAVPVLHSRHPVRPLWHEDLSAVVAESLPMEVRPAPWTFDLVGPDSVTHEELYDRIAGLIARRPTRIPVPDLLASYASKLRDALRLPMAFDASYVSFLEHGSGEAASPFDNSAFGVFGVRPTALDAGLRKLVNSLTELTPSDGVGSVQVKKFSAVIRDSAVGAAELMRLVRLRFKDVMPVPVGVEPASGNVELLEGSVVTLGLPGRGHVQVRVEEVSDHHVVLATLQGHVLAGVVRFCVQEERKAIRFEIITCDAAANAFDWLTLTLGGARVQDANWMTLIRNVAALAGGRPEPIASDIRTLGPAEAYRADRWIRSMIDGRRQRLNGTPRRTTRARAPGDGTCVPPAPEHARWPRSDRAQHPGGPRDTRASPWSND